MKRSATKTFYNDREIVLMEMLWSQSVTRRCSHAIQAVQKGPQNLFPRNPEAPVTVQLGNKAKYFWQHSKGQSQFECRLSPKYPLYHPPIPQTTWWGNDPNLCWSSAPFWGHDPCRAAHKSLTKELLLLVNLTTLKCHCLDVKASVRENIFSIFVEIGSKAFTAWAGHQNL